MFEKKEDRKFQYVISKITEGSRKYYNDSLANQVAQIAYNIFIENLESGKKNGYLESSGATIDINIHDHICEICAYFYEFDSLPMDDFERASMSLAIGCITATAAEKYIRNNWKIYNPHIDVYIGEMGETLLKYKGKQVAEDVLTRIR